MLNITIEVYRISATYISRLHGATKAVIALLQELKHLKKVLLELDELATSLYNEKALGARLSSLQRVDDTQEYQDTLQEVCQKLLERLKGSKLSVKSLTWPFPKTKTNAIITKLRKNLTKFQAALGNDTLSVSLTSCSFSEDG